MASSEYEEVVDALLHLVPEVQPDGRILLRLAGTDIFVTEDMIRPLQEFLVAQMCKTFRESYLEEDGS